MKQAATLPAGLSSLPRRQIMITLYCVMASMFLSSLDQTIVGTAMPRIITSLGGFSQYTWITTIYIITSAVTIPIIGKLTDMYGRKQFYIGGIALFVFASLLCGLSQSMLQLIIFRGLQGIGRGAMMSNSFTSIGDLFPAAERGKYQGYLGAVLGLSAIIGPTLGGWITDNIGWHWVFFINIPLGIIIMGLFVKYFPNFRPDERKHQIDYLGVMALVLCVVPTMLALSWGGVDYDWNSPVILGMFLFSAAMLGL